MNKSQLVEALSMKTGDSKAAIYRFLDAFIETVTETLKKGDKVALVGFGTFSVVQRAERKGMNPQTKKEIIIPATKVPKFKPGSQLKAAVK